ncbi:MAG TPA: hypothetical protein GXX49_03505 [Clostridiaceae bacterium]|nr:hypothetical protein [Clostridiaceae bacterium]
MKHQCKCKTSSIKEGKDTGRKMSMGSSKNINHMELLERLNDAMKTQVNKGELLELSKELDRILDKEALVSTF